MTNLFYFLFILTFFFCGCEKKDEWNCNSITSAPDKYNYPVKPGSSEWNAAIMAGIGQSYPLDSVYKLSQIPSNILYSISTIGLIQSLEDNPCMFNMFLRDNKIQGRNEVLSRLNVSWELNKRSDAGVTIVNYYALKDPNSAVCLSSELERGSFANKWHLFDMVCTQDSILNQLDKATKKRFTTIVIDKYRAQLEYSNTFGSTKTTSMLIISEIMLTEKFQPYLDALQSNTDLHVFALTGILRSGDLYDIVLKYGTQFINS